MERTKLKMAVVVLLLVTNLLLLSVAVFQHRQNVHYTREGISGAMTYLKSHGIQAEQEDIPWSSSLPDSPEKVQTAEVAFLLGDEMPEGESFSLENARRGETLVVDLANGLDRLGVTGLTVESITEGYRYEAVSRSLSPVWRVKTDSGVFYLNCADGTLTVAETTF